MSHVLICHNTVLTLLLKHNIAKKKRLNVIDEYRGKRRRTLHDEALLRMLEHLLYSLNNGYGQLGRYAYGNVCGFAA